MVSIMEVEEAVPMAAATTSPMIEVIAETTTTADMEAEEQMTTTTTSEVGGDKVLEPWEERLIDAQEILSLASSSTNTLRPTTRMHLEALGKRLQKEGEALQRVASSKKSSTANTSSTIPSSTGNTNGATAAATSSPPLVIPLSSSVKYVPIDRFAFDAGGYNEPFVTLYIDIPEVGTVRDSVSCKFSKSSFDLIVTNLHNKSYRLYKDCLEKDIDPDKSKYIVKANKVLVKLAKIKTSDFGGFDYWTKLSDPKKSSKGGGIGSGTNNNKNDKMKDDPSASIMDMMKQMYDDGDDNMKKIIGETMMKQRNGEMNNDKPGMPDFGGKSGGSGGIDDMDDF